MRVERFFLFFGPTIWSFKRGETEYGVKAIPLGGYVKITGMNPEEELPPEDEHRAYYRQKVWKRIVVDRRRAGGEHRARLRDPLRRLPVNVQQDVDPDRSATIRAGTPGREGAAAGRPDPRRRRQVPIAGLDAEDTARTASAKTVGSHECAGEQVDGCVAATPVAAADPAATAQPQTILGPARVRHRRPNGR